jgi:serine/threonine protein kinase/tetratricopeptide (TPR) repeat protein
MTVEADKLRELFLAALKVPAGGREAYLRQACTGTGDLRERVELLIQAHEELGSIAPSAEAEVGPTIDQPMTETPGTLIGPFKLLEQIGEGGFGIVFMAEQQQPIRRKVALKILKPGMDTRQVIARFEAERQALALMEHPNIARVLDAGQTSSRRPYFVMDLVKGIPITEYCDQNQLPVRERLELFVHVCQAVQHAHQKGIIHRDIKPSNVMVTLHDGTPTPKIIDFGVAKALGQQLTDKTLYTGFAQLIGTPMYMSPEQAALSGLDVDTRSDIYSLGVLLYELMTGTTPFDKERFSKAGYDEMRRIIREEEPPKPSTRISTLGQGATTVSTQRKCDSKRLSQLFRGELDWVVMKCLEKDRNRRYETANSLGADIRHYLCDEPVLACPPAMGYRLKKFWHRNRGLVSATAVVLVCLVVGIVGTSWGLLQAVQAQSDAERDADAAGQARRAEELQRELAEKEKARAEENLKQARLAVDKLFTRVAQDMANKPHMEEIRRALLVDALQFYQGFLAQKGTDPEMRHETARAYSRVAGIQQMLGHSPEAEAAGRQAVALMKKLVDDLPGVPAYRVDLVEFRASLAYFLNFTLHHEEDAEVRRQVLADAQKLAADFPTVPAYQRRVAYAETDLGNALMMPLGRLKEAEQHYRQAVAAWKRLEGDFPREAVDHYGISHSRLWLGVVLTGMGRLPEAEPELRQAVALRERLVAQFPDDAGLKAHLAHARHYLGSLLRRAGKPLQAVQTCQRAVAIREKLRDDFPQDFEQQRRLVTEYGGLAEALLVLGRTQEAEDARRQALAVAKKLVADHPGVPGNQYSLAGCYYALGLLLHDTKRLQDAADAFRQAQVLYEETAAKSPEVARFQTSLARLFAMCPATQFRDPIRAIEAAKRALQREPTSSRAWHALGIAQYRAGSWQAALEALTKVGDLTDGGDSGGWFFIAMLHWQRGNKEEARRWYQQAVDWMQEHQPGDPELRRFRAEAAELLEVKEKK